MPHKTCELLRRDHKSTFSSFKICHRRDFNLDRSYTIPDSSHTGLLFASDRGYTTPRESDVTPLRFRGVKPHRFGGEVKINPIFSAPHSISCNCTNPMRYHSSWASQLSKTIDLDIAVQVYSVSRNCNQIWVCGIPVSCNCNESSAILTNQSDTRSTPVSCNPGLKRLKPSLSKSGH